VRHDQTLAQLQSGHDEAFGRQPAHPATAPRSRSLRWTATSPDLGRLRTTRPVPDAEATTGVLLDLHFTRGAEVGK
jgi:hypothetical protein